MQDSKIVTLEDGINYIILDEIENDDTKYIYLANENDASDIVIRKIIIEELEDIIIGLDNDMEFDKALLLFQKKHKEMESI